ncbi:MAG: hypothetical protein F6K08_34810 [Okeania sp. SIO1H6]|nr:hypothetical protein [Okeania sp. SIO1H6]
MKEYNWWGRENEPPKNLKTQSQLQELGLKSISPVGVIHCRRYDVKLYDINNESSVRAKEQISEKQEKSLEKARHIAHLVQELQFYLKTNWEADAAYNDSVKAARTIMSNKESYVILDTETTGRAIR